MTRIVNDGAEMRDLLLFSAVGTNIAVDNAAPVPFASDYYYKTSYIFAQQGGLIPVGSQTELYIRARILITSDVGGPVATFPIFQSGGTLQAHLGISGANTFAAYRGGSGSGTLLQDSGVAMLEDVWYLVEVYYKMDDAPNGRFVLKVDGNQIIDFTGDTEQTAAAAFDNVQVNAYGADIGDLCVDDIAINDTAGGSDNSWIGDGVLSKIYPDGDGADSDWHGSDGDDVNNYALCDEFPKDDDATYNYRAGADSGTQQQFTLSDWAGAGRSVLRIYAEARARKTSAAAHTLKLGELAAGGADVVSAGRVLYTNVYNKVVGDDALVNPVSGVAWTEADLDALEFVAEVG